jgi:hypothetical protein
MSDKIFRYKVIETTNKSLKEAREGLFNFITDVFKKQDAALRKIAENINTSINPSIIPSLENIFKISDTKSILRPPINSPEEDRKRREEWVAEKKKEVEDRFDKVLNNSYGKTNFTLNFDISNVKKEDAEHIAKTVADKIRELIDKDPSSIKRTKGR